MDDSVAFSAGQFVLIALLASAVYGLVVFSQRGKGRPGGGVNWNSVESIAVTLCIYVVGQVIAVAGLLLVFGFIDGSPGAVLDRLETDPILQFAFLLAIDLVSIAMVVKFLRLRQTSLQSIGIVRPRWMDVPYATIGFVVYFVLYLIIAQLMSNFVPGFDVDQRQDIGFSTSLSGMELIPVFLSLVILPPIVEEILARGVLYSGLRTRFKMLTAGLITSGIFALAHLPGGEGGTLIWVAAVDTFILSMVLVFVREKRGSLWPSMFIHGIKNSLAFVVLFIAKI